MAEAAALAGLIAVSGGGLLQVCSVLCDRSRTAYTGVLATLLAGMAYQPLNVHFPPSRNAGMMRSAGSRLIIVDAASALAAKELLAQLPDPVVVLFPDIADPPEWAQALGRHTFFAGKEWAGLPKYLAARTLSPLAYLLFTSGSTGAPKGIGISHVNVSAYIRSMLDRFRLGPGHRTSQLFEFTFDLHVHDLFVTWAAGACLYVVPKSEILLPDRFVRQHELTHWFSVPSAAALLRQMRKLKAGALEPLEVSLFCGEALPSALAAQWRQAAPRSIIENLYGPTEATIAFTAYRYAPANEPILLDQSVVPIGHPLPGQEVVVLDEHMVPVEPGGIGELWLGGSQVAAGYWRDPERSRSSFVTLSFPGKNSKRWYRTGDLASWDARCGLIYHGRADQQIKIRGYRVELQEVESVLRAAAETDLVAVIPRIGASLGSAITGLVAFYSGSTATSDVVRERAARCLPEYMLPDEYIELAEMTRNASGKIDRSALAAMLNATFTA